MSGRVEGFGADLIEIPAGRRAVSEAKVEALAESIRHIGLQTPPTVRFIRDQDEGDRIVLVAGAHRLAACKSLGHDFIDCIVIGDDVDPELWEIDENLCRNELSPSERAELTARRKAIYERLHPETSHGSPSVSRQVGDTRDRSSTDRFTADTAKATGQSERKVQRDAERGSKVSQEAMDVIRGTKLDTGAFLDKLKKIDGKDDQISYANRELREAARRDEQRREGEEVRKDNASSDKAIVTKRAAEAAEWVVSVMDIDDARTLAGWIKQLPPKELALAILRETDA